ncbi:MAG: hypothetical protein ABI882_16485 [Acidobacteriota bacterium]
MAKTYLTILEKNGVFSFLGLVEAEYPDGDPDEALVTAVVKLDPREEQTIVKQFPERNDAIRSYEQAVKTSIDRAWKVIYQGVPIRG